MEKPETVEAYLSAFEPATRKLLKQMRDAICKAAPEAEEYIGYGMPAYKFQGPLVYFAGFRNHIGFYATPTGHSKFAKELSKYQQGKGSVQFPVDEPLPLELIARIVKFRMKENNEKAILKKAVKKAGHGQKVSKKK